MYTSLSNELSQVSRGSFWLNLTETIPFFKYKNGGVRPKSFIVDLLKWSCLRLNTNRFSGSRCILASGTSHWRFLKADFAEFE